MFEGYKVIKRSEMSKEWRDFSNKFTRALRKSYEIMIDDKIQRGHSIIVGRNGKPVEISAEELRIVRDKKLELKKQRALKAKEKRELKKKQAASISATQSQKTPTTSH